MRTILIALLLVSVVGAAGAVRVEYTVGVRPKAERVHVTAVLRDLPEGTVTVAMPVWIPGYYVRTDQARGVSGLSVTENGAPLTTESVSPSEWRFRNGARDATVRVDYDVQAREWGFNAGDPNLTLGQMGVYVDKESAFLHPGAALLYLDGHTSAPSTLRLDLPKGWQSTSPLPRDASGAFSAPDYDTLNDSPVQAGRFRRLAFTARGREFEVILTGKPGVKDPVILDVCRRVGEAGIDLLGDAPFDRYQFHLHFPPKRVWPGAGLEHAASSVIVSYPGVSERSFRDRGARLVAHEFAHAWNVKALHPEGLGPFDYQDPPRTPSLWLAEGVTDYVAHLLLVRASLWTPERALESFSGLAGEYRASKGRNATSLETSSLGVWDSGAGSNGSGGTDYYTKGLLAAWVLDTEIGAATQGRRGLVDALRWMMDHYARKGVAYPPDTLLSAIREATGVDVTETYAAAIHGTEDLPLERAADRMGLALRTVQEPDRMLGVALKEGVGGPIVVQVVKGSAAEKAGLKPGDVLLSLDGAPVAAGAPLLNGRKRAIGDRVPLMVRRGTEKELVTVIVQGRLATALEKLASPTPAQRAVRDGLWGTAK